MTEPISWDLAERIAVRVAGREPFADSYHYASLQPDFDELTAEAEELVAAETGLRSLASFGGSCLAMTHLRFFLTVA